MKLRRLACALLATVALAAGCSDAEPTPAAPASPTPVPSTAPTAYGADGLTVRYLGADGQTKTLRVEDFPR